MRRLFVAVLALSLIAVGCGDDDADPASLDTCAGVVDAGMDLLQTAIDQFDSMSAEDLAAMAGSDEPPQAIQDLETDGRALADRAQALGCDEAEIEGMLLDRVGDLQAESIFGQAILEAIRGGEVNVFGG